jgi:hypothetical protein
MTIVRNDSIFWFPGSFYDEDGNIFQNRRTRYPVNRYFKRGKNILINYTLDSISCTDTVYSLRINDTIEMENYETLYPNYKRNLELSKSIYLGDTMVMLAGKKFDCYLFKELTKLGPLSPYVENIVCFSKRNLIQLYKKSTSYVTGSNGKCYPLRTSIYSCYEIHTADRYGKNVH